VWTLKCQNCGVTFNVELTGGQRIIEFAKEQICPHCLKKPEDVTGKEALGTWHHVIGFRSSPKKQ
jgi:hypothetical protein